MQSHDDDQHSKLFRQALEAKMDALGERAKRLTAAGENVITAGTPGEQPLKEWMTPDNLLVRRMAPDPQDVTRISLGGLDAPPTVDTFTEYLVIRGDKKHMIRLLRKALNALQQEHTTYG